MLDSDSRQTSELVAEREQPLVRAHVDHAIDDRGRGEDLGPLITLPRLFAVLINPGVPVFSSETYPGWLTHWGEKWQRPSVPALIKDPPMRDLPVKEAESLSPLALGFSMVIDYRTKKIIFGKHLEPEPADFEAARDLYRSIPVPFGYDPALNHASLSTRSPRDSGAWSLQISSI